MSDLRQAVYEQLTNTAAVSALVGTRIYPGKAPIDAVLPLITWFQRGAERFRHFLGSAQLVDVELQLSCFAATSPASWTLANEVRKALDDFRGLLGSIAVYQQDVKRIRLENWLQERVDPVDKDDIPLWQEILIFRVWTAETI